MGTFRPRLSDGASDPRVKPEDDERREARKNRAQKRIEGRCFGRTLGINPSPSPGWTLVRFGSGFGLLAAGEPGAGLLSLSLPGLPPWRVSPPGPEVRPFRGSLRFGGPIRSLLGSP